MDPNILLYPAPSTVMLDGASVPINSSWRTGIRVMQAIDDPSLNQEGKLVALMTLYFGRYEANGSVSINPKVREPQAAIEAALRFFNLNEPQKQAAATSAFATAMRIWDWDLDAFRTISDFQREYGIDLADQALRMHWWRFWGLFKGLGDTSKTMQAISIRGAVPDESMSAEEKKRLKKRQEEIMLPARTAEEANKLADLIWGL